MEQFIFKMNKLNQRGLWLIVVLLVTCFSTKSVNAQNKKPNILVIWGDDVGYDNLSAYNNGMMGYHTPNIDRIAEEGALFTDAYGEQSCTAGRSAFILGQHPFRTGLMTIGMPGSDHGIPDFAPTLGDILKTKGYKTGQFGKNHLGDQDKHLPTAHGFDEFFGNLYHLNAEDEPETYHYPKDPEFRKKFGPRGVIRSSADGPITDTGPLTMKRMETVDEEFLKGALEFMEGSADAGEPFFLWFNTSRMHNWTRLKESSKGTTDIGLYADGLVEHDGHVGQLLDKLEELGLMENTIIMYTSDNGAQKFSWPDGGASRFRGAKGSSWEGGHRVPLMVRWPGVIKPGTVYNDMISHLDWMPTFSEAAGIKDLPEKLRNGFEANGKTWKVHLDGESFLPYFKNEVKSSPRESYFYFGNDGTMNAVRYKDFKVHFNVWEGATHAMGGARMVTPVLPLIVNLRSDPFESAMDESGAWENWAFENLWLFVPIQVEVKNFLYTIPGYPFQAGSSLSAGGVNYSLIEKARAMKNLEDLIKQMDKLGPGNH
ncbi:arylsulfatase [Lutimonas halocynthiae]|uniref:arylsulfatase n=1 Tax=Lutimonas halocynthiae TaxID=1446477 RepID=UPI0025B3F581|nr:arylsulfatase [Lutimonas halocynthiae]MDN3643070.1 arylsulfatase [Lutimonas halocynthiae]